MNLLFPPKCAGCGERFDILAGNSTEALCRKCRTDWERAKMAICPNCGNECSDCTCTSEMLGKTNVKQLSLFHFGNRPSADRVIYALKRRNNARFFDFASKELAGRLASETKKSGEDFSDAIFTNVPRSRKAIAAYGFDHAEKLARLCAEKTGGTYLPLLARKRGFHGGNSQKKLGADERLANVADAFEMRKNVERKDKTVVLVDDVVTTGSTVRTCFDLLTGAGYDRVVVLSLARTPKNKKTARSPWKYKLGKKKRQNKKRNGD